MMPTNIWEEDWTFAIFKGLKWLDLNEVNLM